PTSREVTGRVGVRWHEIEIVIRAGSRPEISLSGNALHCATEHDIGKLHLSVSACRTHAVAHVIAET
ncbi:MAG: hypothetical protein AAFV88_23450, partial [Planctomycetota bacterium]